MDKTVLSGNTGTLWVRFMRRRGEMDLGTLLRSIYWTAQYHLAILDMEETATRVLRGMAGDRESELIDRATLFMEQVVRPLIVPKALARIEEHRSAGHKLALLTSSTPYVAEPLAHILGIPHVLCTRLHVTDGCFTGTCERPTCYGPGKVHHAERFAAAHDITLDESYFYTDSYSDLPMLERVGQRRVINPDVRLRRHAEQKGWEIEKWY